MEIIIQNVKHNKNSVFTDNNLNKKILWKVNLICNVTLTGQPRPSTPVINFRF